MGYYDGIVLIPELGVPEPSLTTRITMLGVDPKLTFKTNRGLDSLREHILSIRLPDLARLPEAVRAQEAWTLRMTDLETLPRSG